MDLIPSFFIICVSMLSIRRVKKENIQRFAPSIEEGLSSLQVAERFKEKTQ